MSKLFGWFNKNKQDQSSQPQPETQHTEQPVQSEVPETTQEVTDVQPEPSTDVELSQPESSDDDVDQSAASEDAN